MRDRIQRRIVMTSVNPEPEFTDERREYITALLKCVWGQQTDLDAEEATQNALGSFLDDADCVLLQAYTPSSGFADEQDAKSEAHIPKDRIVMLSNQLGFSQVPRHEAVFIKTKAKPLYPNTIRQSIQIITITDPPLQSLYQTIHNIYAPLFLQNDALSSQISQNLKDILADLNTGLAHSMLMSESTKHSKLSSSKSLEEEDKASLISIVRITDEFAYWDKSDNPRQYKRAKKFSVAFDAIHQRYANLSTLDVSEMHDLLEDTLNSLDDVWRADLSQEQQYSQTRMEHLLDLVSHAINNYIIEKFKAWNVWNSPLHDVVELLQEGICLCEKWTNSIEQLTGTIWPSCDEHTWRGKKSAKDEFLVALCHRMEEIIRVRMIFEELQKFSSHRQLNGDEQRARYFAPFRNIKPLYYNIYTDTLWKQAVKEFEAQLGPLEVEAGKNLKDELASITNKPTATIRILQRYRQLLCRPYIAKMLLNEREAILAQILLHLDQVEKDFDSRQSHNTNGHKMHLGKNLSDKVNLIMWGHMLSGRVFEMLQSVSKVMSDLANYGGFTHRADQLMSRLHALVLDSVRTWQEDVEHELDTESDTSLRLSGRLMQVDKKGELIVNYSEFLVTLLRDVRQLSEIGMQHALLYRSWTQSRRSFAEDDVTLSKGTDVLLSGNGWIPTRIRQIATEAEKYYRFGVMLKKVANFYNSLESSIIEEQKPMLLESLLAFENVVQQTNMHTTSSSKNEVTWQNLEECEIFVKQLQDAADKLANDNRRLRRIHDKLAEDSLILMDIDLLRYPSRWKDKWDEMKKYAISSTRSKALTPDTSTSTKKWFLFWDHQIYKVLEAGYQIGLEMLNENLPEIKEIRTEVYLPSPQSSTFTLLLKPPIEDLRSMYYKAMKKFISRPNKFTGFTNSQLYSKMCDNNAHNLLRVFETCESLFTRLEALLVQYESWSILTRIAAPNTGETNSSVSTEAEDIMDQVLKDPKDWDSNLKTLKAKRKEVEKVPDFVKLDCLTVSFLPFKQGIEQYMQQFQELLAVTLKKSTTQQLENVEDFLESALQRLSTRPRSIEEISQAQTEWKVLEGRKAEVEAILHAAETKKQLLLQTLATMSSYNSSSYASTFGGNVSDSLQTMSYALDTTSLEQRFLQIPTQWENFEISLEAFNDMIQDQRENLKGEVKSQVVNCNMDIDRFKQRWTALRPLEIAKEWWDDYTLLDTNVFMVMEDWKDKLATLKEQAKNLTSNSLSFELSEPHFEGLTALDDEMEALYMTWKAYKDFRTELSAFSEQDWFAFCANIFALQDCAQKWADFVKNNHDKIVKETEVYEHIMDYMQQIKRSMPALKLCRGEPFKDDHWTQLFRKLNLPRDVDKRNLAVKHFLDKLEIVEAPSFLQFVKVLHARAQGEVTIRDALRELRAWTETATLSLLKHEHENRNIFIIKDWKEIMLSLGDNQSLLASLKESQFFKAFEGEASQYETQMALLDQALTQLNIIQRKWIFLEPIFSKGALPSEQSRFRRVDDEFTTIMSIIEQDPKLFNLADDSLFPQLLDRLSMMMDQLERCQKALSDFLEEKRSRMPRFYFLGDEDLLEILGQSQNPAVIQSHLKKLFQGVHHVEFSPPQDQIIGMWSSASEYVQLNQPVKVTEAVEEWLQMFTAEMRRTIRLLILECTTQKDALDYQLYPSQVMCVAHQIKFCQQVEHAVTSGTMKNVKDQLQETLRSMSSLDLTTESLLQLKIKSMILDIVHHLDICDQLILDNCHSINTWCWQKQLRLSRKKASSSNRQQSTRDVDDGVVITMSNAEFDYTYEYQGNASKLVHTPLTDKCFLTLTQGMNMGFGGNPYGPAGTGKTESVKALGGYFGRQVLVFNCDEGIDFQSMGRILLGLVKSGAWGCFDEFNRLKEDQLSAISQQIQVIQDAIKDRTSSIMLLNRQVEVDSNAGIFVTLNPAGKGYGGRSKLPNNLKALFRPVAMGIPDNNLIAEVILYSEGFTQAKDIASKVVSLYKLSNQLLSPQQHYDWGLRALKAVLNTAGKLLQGEKQRFSSKENTISQHLSVSQETEILIKAVRINTLSKLTYVDSVRFLDLINDVFPGSISSDISGGELEIAIRQVMVEKPFFFQIDEMQIRKMLQLKESLDQRMGCVVVGPSGSGKSAVWQTLQASLIKCGQLVKTYVMNPKSMPRERLLGYMDLDTREWTDGVLTAAARQVVKEADSIRSWIVCDGDVDPEWIESLNSVLDDNHLLTLPNGERINFAANVNFLFETHDLKFASPATISRMGMIYLSDQDTGTSRLVHKWLQSPSIFAQGTPTGAIEATQKKRKEELEIWIEELFTKALQEVVKYEQVVVTTLAGIIWNGLSHVATATTRAEFVCAMIRGLGANLNLTDRSSFAKSMYLMANERPPDLHTSPLDSYCNKDTFFRYVDLQKENLKDMKVVDTIDTVVPTASVQRQLHTIAPWVNTMSPFILVGPEGCGKSMIIHHAFKSVKNAIITVLHCNAQTTADDVIHKITQSCSLFSTLSGRVYRPRDCERLVLYLKDINLPKPDQYETCMLIAFLQQLITSQGFYDRHLEFLGIDKIQIVASINAATTVGRHPLNTRFTAIVKVAAMDYPSTEELQLVYASLLEAVLTSDRVGTATTWLEGTSRERLAKSLVEIWDTTRQKFNVDEKRHYLFTPRDLTKWVFALGQYDIANDQILDIVTYEARRLFRDRLVDSDSALKFDSLMSSILKQQWKHTIKLQDVYFTSLMTNQSSNKTEAETVSSKLFQRIESQEYELMIAQGIQMYEREEKELHMLLFDEILDHVAIIERVLSRNNGSLLLVGLSGVGRRTATALVTHMLHYTLFTPSLTRFYNATNFRNNLKMILVKAAVEGQHYVIYMEDHHLEYDDSILETINSLLAAGEVPGLYTQEEIEPQITSLKEKMLEESSSGSTFYRSVYDFFVARVRQYVHVVLAMDPRHPNFVIRCESNPALYTKCTIAWMGEWNPSSLNRVPEMLLLESDNFGGMLSSSVLKLLLAIYDRCRTSSSQSSKNVGNNATPRELICFLQCWRTLCEKHSKQVVQEIQHLKGGLTKLVEASDTVDSLSKNAVIKKKELIAAQVAADEAMDEIKNALEHASINRREVEDLTRQLAKAEEATNARKKEIETELSEINPILQSAKEAVGNIKSDNLNEIRSLKMPPEPIHDVLSAVLMLLGIQDTSWNSMKKFLGNRGVKDDILNYDARRITADIFKAVTKLLKSKPSSFDNDTIYRVSVAAAPLAIWVKANMKYSLVLNKIEPLEADLTDAKRSLESSQQRLLQCETELQTIDRKVDLMKNQFAEKTKEAEILRVGLERAENTLNKAQGLLGKLGGEKQRWSIQVKELEHRLQILPVRMLLAAGYTTFLGKCSEDTRADMVRFWEQDMTEFVAESQVGFDYLRLLSTESELLTWKGIGLPSDTLSMENALIISNSSESQCPFIIDPAGACTTWLHAELAKDTTRPLTVVHAQDARFVNIVEQAVRFGKTLIILEIDSVEPFLYPLVRKDLLRQGPRFVVSLGEKVIDYNENFRLILVTRNPSPPLPPDALAIINVVNFTVTKSGLQGQLLGVTIQHEQPALEQEKSELLRQEEECKLQLALLEKQLVQALATSEGDILENTILIESLTKTKTTSAEIEQALERSGKKSEELDEKRDMYRGFAQQGAKLYFLVKQLSAVNHMYRFSLASFLSIFKETLAAKMEFTSSAKERTIRLVPILEYKILLYVGRAIFKDDRPMFGMHLVHEMHPECFEVHEYDFFCGNLVSKSEKSDLAFPSWAPPERKEAFNRFSSAFPTLMQQCKFENTDMWLRWVKSPECEQAFHPKIDRNDGNSSGLSSFQKLLVVQTLRPDRLQSSIIHFICGVMNVKSLNPPPLDFRMLGTEEAIHTTPILLLTTLGADPGKELEEVASVVVGKDHYFELAMGGGQQEKALQLLRTTAERGDWLCLQNLHLVIAWLPVLEKELSSLIPHHKFRLWLTTEPHDAFPLILIEQSLICTFESPPGMKKNLQGTCALWNPEFIARGSVQRAQLLFLLAYFHAILQERRTYIPQGWSKFYEFSYGDFRAGSNVIELASLSHRNEGSSSEIDWLSLHGLMDNAIYGGRIDNPFDLRVLRCYIQEFFNSEYLAGKKQLLRGIKLPQTTHLSEYLDIIDHLPDSDSPGVFVLPDNIERSVQRTMSDQVIGQLKALSSNEQSVGSFDREKWRQLLGPILENWTKWTYSFGNELSGDPSLTSGSKTLHIRTEGSDSGKGTAVAQLEPVDAFVSLENEYAIDLTQQIHSALSNLKKVLYGTEMLTPAIQSIATSLLRGVVPPLWSAKWEGSSDNVQMWLLHLANRRKSLMEWQNASQSGKLLFRELDLSELLHPSTFLNALRQQSARELQCSMDALVLQSCWEKNKQDDVKWYELKNLLLQGASFEGQVLLEAISNAPELVLVPPCHIAFVRGSSGERIMSENQIHVPLYYSPNREKLLCEVAMPISGERSRWILAGVALFLNE